MLHTENTYSIHYIGFQVQSSLRGGLNEYAWSDEYI